MASPLDGIKVLDMGWLMVGPASARYLTDLGAETIKLESRKRLDPLRSLGPFKDGRPGPERSLSYHKINASKRSIAINLRLEQGKKIARRLANWADILIESFTPGAIDEMGLSYDTLRESNPGLIMVSTGILGRTGPYGKGTSGTGVTGASYAGATALLGWKDRKPYGPRGPWTDAVAPRFVVSAILAALHRRQQTGEGCHIDVAQAECGVQFLLPAFMQYAANRVDPERDGRAGSPLRAPYGIYRCAGHDRWIAIDASSDPCWRALRELVGGELHDAAFRTLIGRLRNRERLDQAIAAWTDGRDAIELEERLQQAGVAAHVVSHALDLTHDGDLRHQGYFRPIEDAAIGATETIAPQFELSKTPMIEPRAAPRIGDSTGDILRFACGYSQSDIDRFAAEGVTE